MKDQDIIAGKSSMMIYITEDGLTRIETTFDEDTVWLSIDQMAELFQRDKSTISRHIKNIFSEGELSRDSVVAKIATTAADGKTYQVEYYNLDVIISIGYRVKLRKTEVNLLKDFLYEAIFIPRGAEPPERDIVEKPELRVYTDDFGTREGDNCLVADFGGNVVGAVWTRIMNDYGHMDDDTPSFAISLYKDYRGQGIGSQLMVRMLELLKWQGYKRASLAVQKANYAVEMHEKVGFKTVDENVEEYIMVCEL